MIADAALRAAQSPSAPDPLRRVLLAGFAASAATDSHLAAVRALLDDEVADLTLRAALVRALAVRDLATPADLAALTSGRPGSRAAASGHVRGGATGPGGEGSGLDRGPRRGHAPVPGPRPRRRHLGRRPGPTSWPATGTATSPRRCRR